MTSKDRTPNLPTEVRQLIDALDDLDTANLDLGEHIDRRWGMGRPPDDLDWPDKAAERAAARKDDAVALIKAAKWGLTPAARATYMAETKPTPYVRLIAGLQRAYQTWLSKIEAADATVLAAAQFIDSPTASPLKQASTAIRSALQRLHRTYPEVEVNFPPRGSRAVAYNVIVHAKPLKATFKTARRQLLALADRLRNSTWPEERETDQGGAKGARPPTSAHNAGRPVGERIPWMLPPADGQMRRPSRPLTAREASAADAALADLRRAFAGDPSQAQAAASRFRERIGKALRPWRFGRAEHKHDGTPMGALREAWEDIREARPAEAERALSREEAWDVALLIRLIDDPDFDPLSLGLAALPPYFATRGESGLPANLFSARRSVLGYGEGARRAVLRWAPRALSAFGTPRRGVGRDVDFGQAQDTGRYRPASWFAKGASSWLRKAAAKTRRTKRVKRRDDDGVQVYCVADVEKWRPDLLPPKAVA